MDYSISMLFILFMTYSILGWCMEMLVCFHDTKKLVNRGFLIGPYCPIYGWGGVAIIILLNRYYDDPIILFVMSMFICSLLEYFTSYIMEKLFKARWWDYSHKKYEQHNNLIIHNIPPHNYFIIYYALSLLIIFNNLLNIFFWPLNIFLYASSM